MGRDYRNTWGKEMLRKIKRPRDVVGWSADDDDYDDDDDEDDVAGTENQKEKK